MNRVNNRYLVEAKKALRRGDRQAGLWLARKSIIRYPKHVDGWLLFGGLTKPDVGLQYLRKAKFLAPYDPLVDTAIQWAVDKSLEVKNNRKINPPIQYQKVNQSNRSNLQEKTPQKKTRNIRFKKKSEAKDTLICPYLGLRRDPNSVLGYSSIWNVCHRTEPATTPTLSHQCSSCLTPLYTDCPVYNSPAGGKLPKKIKHKSFYPFS